MYPAIERYPHRDKNEHILLTDFSVRLVKKFIMHCESHGIKDAEAGRLIGVSEGRISRYRHAVIAPIFPVYLRMRLILGGDVGRRDINYAYAMVSYPPEEIKRRLKRLGYRDTIGRANMRIGTKQCARELGVSPTVLCDTLNYSPHRSVLNYWRLMTWLAAKEKERGYDDALKFYK